MPEVQAAQLYSYSYGHIVFDALLGRYEGLAARMEPLTEYEECVDFGDVELALIEADDPAAWSYRNEVNFHHLNHHMQKMWLPLITGGWEHPDGQRAAGHFSMNGLALEGLKYYVLVNDYTAHKTPEALEDPVVKGILSRFTGAMQEFDATIATLNWAKKYPNITVIPAPAQFEHSTGGTGTNANADLLVIDFVNDRTVGVQIKTLATERERRRYDPDRIVVVDSADLGNVRVIPDKHDKTKQTTRPWPGLIAAARVDAIPTKGKLDIKPKYIPYLLAKKMQARMQLRGSRVDYNNASAVIGKKILEKL
ncbi:MAG TPA: hypothetical protein VLH84_04985 [Patescibacteria group bacterium]|nr:hypothetical protein [Patescibacteria group bacterium]